MSNGGIGGAWLVGLEVLSERGSESNRRRGAEGVTVGAG